MGVFLVLLTTWICTAQANDPVTPTVVQDLSERAETVVRGEVLHHRLMLDQDGVWTIAMIRVTETLQGTAAPIREVRLPGGRLSDLEVMVAKAPQLLPGDDVLLFLKGDRIVGLGQGAFVIAQDRAWRALDAWTLLRPQEIDAQRNMQGSIPSLAMAAVREALSRAGASTDRPSSVSR